MPINSKKKGNKYENDVAAFFRDLGFTGAKRNLTETQTGGQGIDLVETGVFDVQCKNFKKYVSITKIHEVPKVDGRIALLFTKGCRQEPMVVMRQSDFAKLYKGEL